MREIAAAAGPDVEAASLAACVASVFELEVPPLAPGAALLDVRQWLAQRNFGLAEIADPQRFAWPGYWLARDAAARWVVMFGVPSAVVWDPTGHATATEAIVAGLLPAPLALTPPMLAGPGTSAAVAGQVELICVAAGAEAPATVVDQARALAGRGLDGDRYAAAQGTFSSGHGSGRALTLVEGEVLDELRLPDGRVLAPHEARRNIVTRGVRLDDLIGRHFRIGTVACYGQRRCEPCAHLQRLTHPGVLRALAHRGGLRADILSDGVIRMGDALLAD
jgi:MOSC domain-containing protein YiiM